MGGVGEYYHYAIHSLQFVENFNGPVLNCLSGEKWTYFSSNKVE
jgi:hypothetical protein